MGKRKRNEVLEVYLEGTTLYGTCADETTVKGKRIFKTKERGIPISADELLSRLKEVKAERLKIPIKSRSELPELPPSELLGALHYYTSNKIAAESQLTAKRKKRANYKCMDETALIAMGLLAEQLVDHYITKDLFQMFMEHDIDDE